MNRVIESSRIPCGSFCKGHFPRLLVVLVLLCLVSTLSADVIDEGIVSCAALEDDRPVEAIALASSILEAMDVEQDPVRYGRLLGCMGWAMATQNDVEGALEQARQLEVLGQEQPVNSDSVYLLRRAGSIYHRLGNRISASACYDMAMQRADSLNLIDEQIPILVNLGVLNSELKEHDRAIATYNQALSLMEQTEDYRYQAPVLFNLAVTLNGQSDHQAALAVYQQVEAQMNEHWPNSRSAIVYQGLASAHMGLGNNEQAMAYINKAMALMADSSQGSDLLGARATYATLLFNRGDRALAAAEVDEIHDALMAGDYSASASSPLLVLARLLERMGEHERALTVFHRVRQDDVALQKSFNTRSMAEMEARLQDSRQRQEMLALQHEKAQAEIGLVNARHERDRWLILIACLVVAGVLFMIWQLWMNRRLRDMSMRDMLTHLGNRRAIMHWMKTHPHPDAPARRLIWLIDLDHFKAVNDRHGHHVGDQLLIRIAQSLKDIAGERSLVARWGGEEFMLITDQVRLDRISEYARGLLETIAQSDISHESEDISVTASIGVSQILDDSTSSWNDALAVADQQLYLAKESGRNRCASEFTAD